MAWPTVPGSGGLTIDGDFRVASTHNILLGSAADAASAQNVLALANALTDPVSLGGQTSGKLYVHSGTLLYMSPTGNVVSIAAVGGGGFGGDLLAANNLSDVDDVSSARNNLGLEIGVDVQAFDADLSSLGALSWVAGAIFSVQSNAAPAMVTPGNSGQIPISQGSGSIIVFGTGAPGDLKASNNLSDVANTTSARASIGVIIGTDVQAFDADLSSLGALSWVAGQVLAVQSNASPALVAAGNSGTLFTSQGSGSLPSFGSIIGTHIQAYSSLLSSLSALSPIAGGVFAVQSNAAPQMVTPGTSGQSLISQGSGYALGWGTPAGGGDMVATNNLSDVASVGGSRINLGLGTAAVENVNSGTWLTAGALATIASDVQEFDVSGTWTKPTVTTTRAMALIEIWGCGGGGARRSAGNGGGGGGGSYWTRRMDLADLGATETVTIGAGAGVQATDNTDGNNGGNCSFGAHLTVYGGRGGGQAAAGSTAAGGGGAYPADIWTAGAALSAGWPAGLSNNSPASAQQGLTISGGGATGANTANAVATVSNASLDLAGGGGGHSTTGPASGLASTSIRAGSGGDGNGGGAGANGSAPGGGGGSGTTQGGSGAAGRVRVTVW